MLINFKFSNVLSFGEENTLDLKAGKYTKHANHVIRSVEDYKLLRMAAIYGANAAGKTNLIYALRELRDIITAGTVDKAETLLVKPFKFSDPETPVKFDIEYSTKKNVYKYILEIQTSVIKSEILYKLDARKNNFIEVFTRKSEKDKTNALYFNGNTEHDQKEMLRAEIYKEDLRSNQPFLKEGSNKSFLDIYDAYDWFVNKLIIIAPNERPYSVFSFFINEYNKPEFKELFKRLDTGISDITVDKKPLEDYIGIISEEKKNYFIRQLNRRGFLRLTPERNNSGSEIEVILENDSLKALELVTTHTGANEQTRTFMLKEESMGIRRLFDLIPALYKIDKDEVTIFIDEFEKSIHPMLLINLLKYLNKEENLKGQLIFSTHEATLLDLDLFRQDEVWFVEKDKYGSSHLYSLSEFKPRFDKDIRKDYLQGRFGAIPFLLGSDNFLKE